MTDGTHEDEVENGSTVAAPVERIVSAFFKPTLQTKFDEEGNCLSACIATLFDVAIDDVPVFADYEYRWVEKMSEWMCDRFGKYAVLIRFPEVEECRLFNGSHVIACIKSPNPLVERHAVIAKDGRILFDPMTGFVDCCISDDLDPTFIVFGDIREH
jgi:hypothetical protein